MTEVTEQNKIIKGNILPVKSVITNHQIWQYSQTHCILIAFLTHFYLFQESIAEASVKKFCKEASNLRLHRDSASIADEIEGRITQSQSELGQTLDQNPDSEAVYYLVLRAVDR